MSAPLGTGSKTPAGRQPPCPFTGPGAPFGDVFPPPGAVVASSGAGELLPAGPSHEHPKGR